MLRQHYVRGLGGRAANVVCGLADIGGFVTPAAVRKLWPEPDKARASLLRERNCGPAIAAEITRWAYEDNHVR